MEWAARTQRGWENLFETCDLKVTRIKKDAKDTVQIILSGFGKLFEVRKTK
jgi:hypothetical protein